MDLLSIIVSTKSLHPHSYLDRILSSLITLVYISHITGPLTSGEVRTHPHARAVFPNGDTYFGGYSEDLKSGPGIYLFAAGVGGAWLGRSWGLESKGACGWVERG